MLVYHLWIKDTFNVPKVSLIQWLKISTPPTPAKNGIVIATEKKQKSVLYDESSVSKVSPGTGEWGYEIVRPTHRSRWWMTRLGWPTAEWDLTLGMSAFHTPILDWDLWKVWCSGFSTDHNGFCSEFMFQFTELLRPWASNSHVGL